MNEVGLHAFIGKCGAELIETLFPTSDKLRLTGEEMKEAIVFKESVGNEITIAMFFQYIDFLEKYEEGAVMKNKKLKRLIIDKCLFGCSFQFLY